MANTQTKQAIKTIFSTDNYFLDEANFNWILENAKLNEIEGLPKNYEDFEKGKYFYNLKDYFYEELSFYEKEGLENTIDFLNVENKLKNNFKPYVKKNPIDPLTFKDLAWGDENHFGGGEYFVSQPFVAKNLGYGFLSNEHGILFFENLDKLKETIFEQHKWNINSFEIYFNNITKNLFMATGYRTYEIKYITQQTCNRIEKEFYKYKRKWGAYRTEYMPEDLRSKIEEIFNKFWDNENYFQNLKCDSKRGN